MTIPMAAEKRKDSSRPKIPISLVTGATVDSWKIDALLAALSEALFIWLKKKPTKPVAVTKRTLKRIINKI